MRSQYWAESRGVAGPMCVCKSPLTPAGEGMEQGTGIYSYCHSTVKGKEDQWYWRRVRGQERFVFMDELDLNMFQC